MPSHLPRQTAKPVNFFVQIVEPSRDICRGNPGILPRIDLAALITDERACVVTDCICAWFSSPVVEYALANSYSDSDFEEEAGARRRGSSSTVPGVCERQAASYFLFTRVRSIVSKSKKRKIQQWKLIPVCVQSPHTVRVPNKGHLDSRCKVGLGSK